MRNPLWALDPAEAKSLADAVQNVTRHHDVMVAQKTIDYINLAIVAGMVYGTRLITIQRERAATRTTAPVMNATDAELSHASASPQSQFN